MKLLRQTYRRFMQPLFLAVFLFPVMAFTLVFTLVFSVAAPAAQAAQATRVTQDPAWQRVGPSTRAPTGCERRSRDQR